MNSYSYCSPRFNIFKLSRRGRKLPPPDDRTLMAMPKDINERTWAELFENEENDLLIFEFLEEILENVIDIVYTRYLERQSAPFTVYCAAEAWMQLIKWHFFHHDPGEDISASPLCKIPNRAESWIPDERPMPSPKDTYSQQNLQELEEIDDLDIGKAGFSSFNIPVLESIPKKYWFPGKVSTTVQQEPCSKKTKNSQQATDSDLSRLWFYNSSSNSTNSWTTEDELEQLLEENIQRITDYDISSLKISGKRSETGVNGSLQGAGDSTVVLSKKRRDLGERSHTMSKSKAVASKLKLPPLDESKFSVVSDCRLRNLRVDTDFGIASEKLEPENIVTKVKRQ